MSDKDDPKNEGHTREWQDRARVVLDAKEAAHTEASPNQSPTTSKEEEDVEEKSDQLGKASNADDRDPAY